MQHTKPVFPIVSLLKIENRIFSNILKKPSLVMISHWLSEREVSLSFRYVFEGLSLTFNAD